MNINELKEGEIYTLRLELQKTDYLIKWGDISHNINIEIFPLKPILFKNGSFRANVSNIKEATPEQKHWLNTCIDNNKFISYDDAMKSFVKEFEVPKYYTVEVHSNEEFHIVRKYMENDFKGRFKNHDDYNPFSGFNRNQYYIGYYADGNTNFYNGYYNKYHAPLITFDQFKQYVLKEVVVNEDVVKQNNLPYQILVKHNEDIIEVANEEGNLFKIGDTVINLNGKFKKSSIIKGFKLSNEGNICALTTLYIKNGISIDKIEHYIEPELNLGFHKFEPLKLNNQDIYAAVVQPKESLLDKAKRLYTVGTEFKAVGANGIIPEYYNNQFIDKFSNWNENKFGIWTNGQQGWIYNKQSDKWAEIISKPEVDNSKYEILSLMANKTNNLYYNKPGNIIQCIGANKKLPNNRWDIYSVKQLSTGNIFTVGDSIKLHKISQFHPDFLRTIESIKLDNNKILFKLVDKLADNCSKNTVLLRNVTKV